MFQLDSPTEEAVRNVRRKWSEQTDAFGRVYTTILGITKYTRTKYIAEMADCSPNTAKKHLERMVDIGLVRKGTDPQVFEYRRNDAYLEWREASRIAEDLSTEEIIDRVSQLESKCREFENRFGTDDPTAVHVFRDDDHTEIHEKLETIGQWRNLARYIQLYEIAHQLAQNDGHLLPK